MTTSRHMATPLSSRRHWTTDRIISAGLAVTACAGIVAVIGVRSIEDSAAAQQTPAIDSSTTPAVSSAGLTEAQLDDYAVQLQDEAARLDAYRVKLTKAAKAANAATPAKPKPIAKPKPAPAPQSNTKSS
jgi:hypothetical protein